MAFANDVAMITGAIASTSAAGRIDLVLLGDVASKGHHSIAELRGGHRVTKRRSTRS